MSRNSEPVESRYHRLRVIAVQIAGLGQILTFVQEDWCPDRETWEGLGAVFMALGAEVREVAIQIEEDEIKKAQGQK